MREEFKTIDVRGVNLEVSNMGRVFKDGVERRYHLNNDGYKMISLMNRCPFVHRLVATAFIKNDDPKNKTEVNHKDFNRENSRVDNLEWVSHKENIKYSLDGGRYNIDRYGINNPNYGNKSLSEFYKNNPDIALKKQSRKGIVNGRATKVDLYKDNLFVEQFEYMIPCLEYIKGELNLTSSVENIRSSVNSCIREGKDYKGYKVIKLK